MEEFWIQLLTILTLLTQICSASDTIEVIGTVGGSVTFHSNNTDGCVAFWNFESDPMVIVEFGDPPRFIFSKDEYKTRFTVSESGRALSISQLRMEDAGTYSVRIDGKISTFTLRVYKELTKPTVTCKSQDCLDRICFFSLHCSVTGTGFGNVSYTWTGWDQRWEGESVMLTAVDKTSWDNADLLTCTARNAISNRSATVTIAGGVCPGPLASLGIGVVTGMGVAMLLLLFLVLLCNSLGYRLACVTWRASGSARISATARLGHRGYLQATRFLGPVPGLASDQHGPEPGLAMDQNQHWTHTSATRTVSAGTT